jgi:hypothetical protein
MFRCVLLLIATATCVAAQNSFCQISTPNGTVNLGYIKAAKYENATIVLAESGPTTGTVNFGWCGTVDSAACNITNATLAIYDNSNNCIVHFSAFIGPASFASNVASFQLWSASSGAVGSVSVACNPQGAQGAATLVGFVVNQPIFSYTLTFSSVHACPK